MPKLLDTNKMVFNGTFRYYMGLVNGFTVAEALAVLKILGSYHLDAIWYVSKDANPQADLCIDKDGTYWEHVSFDKMPVNSRCKIKHIGILIRFYGGPPGEACYYKGTLGSFVCDRILQCVIAKGKTPVSQYIMQTLARMRRK